MIILINFKLTYINKAFIEEIKFKKLTKLLMVAFNRLMIIKKVYLLNLITLSY
jgi:hypothetical protein